MASIIREKSKIVLASCDADQEIEVAYALSRRAQAAPLLAEQIACL
jgi:hypothetical protein